MKKINFMLELLLYLIVGAGISIYGTLVGIGGGFILVPILLLLFNFSPSSAAGTSLAVVFLNALSGSTAYLKQKKVDIKSGIIFFLATLPGTIIGSCLTAYFTNVIFYICFGIMLAFLSVILVFRSCNEKYSGKYSNMSNIFPAGKESREIIDMYGKTYKYCFSMPVAIFICFLAGFISGIFGVGGGIILMPTMILLLSFPEPVAVGTSIFALAFTALSGTITHFALGNVKIYQALAIGTGAVIGAQLSAIISCKIQNVWISRLLAVGLLIIGLSMIFFH